jgi:hypothetical protein
LSKAGPPDILSVVRRHTETTTPARHDARSLTPRRHVEAALRGDDVPKVPFTIYESMIPQCAAERELRSRGLCIVERRVNAFKTHRPNVRVRSETFTEGGREMVRTWYETPAGTLSTLHEPAGFTSWWHERMWKSPGDYKALLFFVQDERYEPNYGELAEAQRLAGEDLIFRAGFGLEPLQSLITGTLMKTEDFCIQWMDNRDEIERIYRAIVENRRAVYPIVADSPVLHANYGGNVIPEVVGPAVFRDYYLPHYNEAAEAMHRKGKLVGCHFDDETRPLAELIARTDLDYIEAFTPAPDTSMGLGDARRAWPGKALWLNFPSSVHVKPDGDVERTAMELLAEVKDARGILMGITENIPQDRWRDSCRAIMDGLDRHARENPGSYKGG